MRTSTTTVTIVPSSTSTATATRTSTATRTTIPSSTSTPTTPRTSTPRRYAHAGQHQHQVPASPTRTPATTPTLTVCPIYFVDAPESHPFFSYIRCLTCRALLSGYPCGEPGEPCLPGNPPYFRPDNVTSRGQAAKDPQQRGHLC